MGELKVGDWVKCDCFFKGAKQIKDTLLNDGYCKIGGYLYHISDLTLVCGFVKGETVLTGDSKDCLVERVFDSYRPDLKFPFVVLNPYETSISSFKYARAIEPKYVPYTEPKLEWLIEQKQIIMKHNENDVRKIFSILVDNNEYVIGVKDLLKCDRFFSLEEAFEKLTWLDGSPCGELKD